MKKLFEKYFYSGTLEDLISDLDEMNKRYALIVDLINRTYYYEPNEIDCVEPELLNYSVNWYKMKKEKNGIVITVDACPPKDPWND